MSQRRDTAPTHLLSTLLRRKFPLLLHNELLVLDCQSIRQTNEESTGDDNPADVADDASSQCSVSPHSANGVGQRTACRRRDDVLEGGDSLEDGLSWNGEATLLAGVLIVVVSFIGRDRRLSYGIKVERRVSVYPTNLSISCGIHSQHRSRSPSHPRRLAQPQPAS